MNFSNNVYLDVWYVQQHRYSSSIFGQSCHSCTVRIQTKHSAPKSTCIHSPYVQMYICSTYLFSQQTPATFSTAENPIRSSAELHTTWIRVRCQKIKKNTDCMRSIRTMLCKTDPENERNASHRRGSHAVNIHTYAHQTGRCIICWKYTSTHIVPYRANI